MKIQQVFLVIAAAGALAALPAPPAGAQQLPDLPDVERLVAARRAVVEGWLGAEPDEPDGGGDGWFRKQGWFRQVIVDRIELNAAYGRGLTITDEDNGGGITTISNFQSQSTWSIKYAVPLKELFDFGSARAAASLERGIADAKRREALRAEEIALREIHNDYLKARAEYQRAPRGTATTSVNRESGFEMRALALKLLVLTELQHLDSFSQWNRFLADAGSERRIASR